MGKHLDLDDVAAGNPASEQELAALRQENELLREVYEAAKTYEGIWREGPLSQIMKYRKTFFAVVNNTARYLEDTDE